MVYYLRFFIAAALMVFLGFGVIKYLLPDISLDFMTEDEKHELKRSYYVERLLRDMKEKMPVKVDDFITLDDVDSLGRSLIYIYEAREVQAEDFYDGYGNLMRAETLKFACSQEMKMLGEYFDMYVYNFHDKDSEFLYSFNVQLSECDLINE